ncbi:tigger transposable element-derived protein 2-like [Ochlerotatus camptorhynchus]|uniref:tigger transposable element-derived protein 2-like n=1 Tax=Ochlerotatus camptorhynchus TaxID=644619 RepID=UPI0031E48513
MSNIAEVQGNIANRKRFKKPRYPAVDEALYVWFLQKRQLNVPVSHEMLQVQAQKFYSQMIGEGEYGSRGTEELRTDDGAIFCKFLPPNTTAVIQPMDQHVIQMVKARYKKIMTNEILGRGDDFHDNVKRINIKDAMFWIAQAWEAVPESAIQKSWKILYTETPGDDEDDLPLSVLQERLRNIMNNINQLETIDEENEEFEILKDDEIVEKILNPSVDDFSYTTNQDHEDSQHLSTSVDPEDENVNVSDEAALNGADVLLSLDSTSRKRRIAV